jgi:hypothetical protein
MNNTIKSLLAFVLALILIGAMLLFVGIDNLSTQLQEMEWKYFIPIIVVYFSTWVIRGERWRLVLQSSSIIISRSNSIKLTFVGYMINLFTPAKLGEFGRVAGLTKVTGEKNLSKSVGTVVVDHFFDFLMVIIFLLTSLFFISTEKLPYWIQVTIWIALIVAIFGTTLLFVLAKKPLLFQTLSSKMPNKIQTHAENLIKGVSDAFNHPKLPLILLFSCYIWVGEVFVTFMILLGLGVNIPIYFVIFSLMIANLTKIIPITPGGMGVFEGVLAVSLVLFNVDKEEASIAAILDHFIKNIVVLIGGIISAITLSINVFLLQEIEKTEMKENEI